MDALEFRGNGANEGAQVVEASPPSDFLDRSRERDEEVGAEVSAGAGELGRSRA